MSINVCLILGAGNMSSVLLPMAENMRLRGNCPVFAVPRNGRYSRFFDIGESFSVHLVDRSSPCTEIGAYKYKPLSELNKLAIVPGINEAREFFITPVENLMCGNDTNKIVIREIYIAVGASNIHNSLLVAKEVVGRFNTAPVPTYLLENLSIEKEKSLKHNEFSSINVLNAVIRRTSSDWRVVNNEVYINTFCEGGSIFFEKGNDSADIPFGKTDGVSFTTISSTEMSIQQEKKFIGTNLVDYFIARYVAIKMNDKSPSEYVFDNNLNLADMLIGDAINDRFERELFSATSFIDNYLHNKFDDDYSSSCRINRMKSERLGRILKKERTAHLEKLNFCKLKTKEYNLLKNNNSVKKNSGNRIIAEALGLDMSTC